MFLLKVPKEKLYVWFDAPIGYISSTKEWACAKEKIGNRTGKIRNKTGSFHWERQYCFHCVIFSSDVESRRKLYFAGQCSCNEF
jgi:methionyl-tRNA synthetase